jgi:hypothetical protein
MHITRGQAFPSHFSALIVFQECVETTESSTPPRFCSLSVHISSERRALLTLGEREQSVGRGDEPVEI